MSKATTNLFMQIACVACEGNETASKRSPKNVVLELCKSEREREKGREGMRESESAECVCNASWVRVGVSLEAFSLQECRSELASSQPGRAQPVSQLASQLFRRGHNLVEWL